MQNNMVDPIDSLKERGFDIVFQSHAKSILYGEFYAQLLEICQTLQELSLPISEIIGSGGGETKFTQRLRNALNDLDWKKHNFEIQKTIDGTPRESISHEVDHVKYVDGAGVLACEIEWNNKDPFFDRDLENYKRLHAEGAISVGIIITRGLSLQDNIWTAVYQFVVQREINSFEDLANVGYTPTPKQKANVLKRVNRNKDPVPFKDAWVDNFVSNKYGQATTHWVKLRDRIDRGVGNPCPLLLIGLPYSIVNLDNDDIDLMEE
ncbi:BglII/BstYI family type II restriction endonuclease [Chromobacterium piscinae]|uniref:BglII/BstYI family type II restriction endonuclease n=1 Tax=Chromobacterium piscinae TaxID=686831 RepID=A0ABV0H6E8_9NEIS